MRREEAEGSHPRRARSPYGRAPTFDNLNLTAGHRRLRHVRWGHVRAPAGTVLLAAPRGYCAGVERAVDAVERALAKHGAPVYVRKQIVHNLHVVRDLESKGAIFVEEETEVPEGAVVVLSAHGVAPSVYENAGRAAPRRDRRDLPAGHEGARRGSPVRRPGSHDRADRPPGSRGGRGHERTGAGANDPRAVAGRCADRRRARPGQLELPDPDDPVGRRDERDRAHPRASGSRRSRDPRATTSATRPRTDRTP